MAHGDLRETRLARERRRLPLVRGMGVGVHEHNGDRGDAVRHRGPQVLLQCARIERLLHRAVGAHALVGLHHAGVEHLGLDDLFRKDVGPRLVADLQLVLEALGYHQQGRLALALEQRVGGDGGAHLDGGDALGGKGCAGRQREELANGLERGIVVRAGVVGEHLAGDDFTGRRARDHVGEGAATVDPEMPPPPLFRAPRICHVVALPAAIAASLSGQSAPVARPAEGLRPVAARETRTLAQFWTRRAAPAATQCSG